MRDATAAIAGSVVETTHRPGLFPSTTTYGGIVPVFVLTYKVLITLLKRELLAAYL